MSDQKQKRMKILSWRPVVKNTLRGFVTIELPIGLIIEDITAHERNGSAWVSLPAKAQFDQGGVPRLVDGKMQYIAVVKWRDRDLTDRFSDALIARLDAEYPEWRG